jgi:hypothetical protein
MDSNVREDYLWLLSGSAVPVLKQVNEDFQNKVNSLTINKRLRKSISPTRAAIVIEQVLLRQKAKVKFERASELFFTRKSLEQATGERIANYKANRFSGLSSIADVCSGIGGDLIALAHRQISSATTAETIGVETDELTALFAAKNLDVLGLDHATVLQTTFEDFGIERFDGIHIDPDRRVKNRTVRGDFFQPSLSEIRQRVRSRQSLAIKVAPATPPHHSTPTDAETQWIGDNRECKEQVIWSAAVAENPGCRTATYINSQHKAFHFTATREELTLGRPKPPEKLGTDIYEPHPTILAAGLVNSLARRLGLKPLDAHIDYLTGTPTQPCKLIRKFRIDVELKLNLKLLSKELRQRKIGQIVVKKRGIDQAIFDNIQALKIAGENKATVIATRHNGNRLALITNIEQRK